MDSARNNILARLKAAQDKRGEIGENIPDFTSPIYHPLNESLSQEFKTNLEIIGGQVILIKSKSEIADQIKQICEEKHLNRIFCTDPNLREILKERIDIDSDENSFLELNIGVTGCEFLVAHLGSVIISSEQIS